MNPREKNWIERYPPGQRIIHWTVAFCFLLLAVSGLALFHPALFWLSAFLGGGPWDRILHPFIGCVMFVVFFWFAAYVWRDNLLDARDWIWLRRIRDVISNHDENVPEIGRYNAGQKLLFITLVLCMIGLLLSGLVIWRVYFSAYFPIRVIRVAALLHAFLAFVLIAAIVVHVYAGFWEKGSIRAMTRGWVSPGWAWKHHRAWYRALMRSSRGNAPPPG